MKKIVALLGVCLSVGMVRAQSVEDIYRMSVDNAGYGTARSAAMGGAFTSLGADAASAFINPAGIGMYRSSDISITPTLKVSSVASVADDGEQSPVSRTENQTSFGLSNLSGFFTLYKGARNEALRRFNMGFGYNKTANFRSEVYSKGAPSLGTIGDFFVDQLNRTGKDPALLESLQSDPLEVYRRTDASLWGAVMAYNDLLLDGTVSAPWQYSINPRGISLNDRLVPSQRIDTHGNTEEYLLSLGFNFWDRLYMGMSLGSRTFDWRTFSRYEENGVVGNVGDMQTLRYEQSTKMSGAAFDFKIGVTVEPLAGLKIGTAFHAPTLLVMDYEYFADMSILYDQQYDASTPYALSNFEARTAPRWLGGVSYRIGRRAIVSLDVERVWYNKMRVKYDGIIDEDFTEEIEDTYQPATNVKVGVEVSAGSGILLRGGYALYGSALSDQSVNAKYGRTQNVSAGVGYRGKNLYADLAYVHSFQQKQPYLYYPDVLDDIAYNVIQQKTRDHLLSLTVGVRF